MNLKNKFYFAAQTLVAISMAALLVAACTSGSSMPGFSQTYNASAGAGEALQLSVNTASLTYSYTVVGTSYATLGVTVGQSGTGNLTDNGNGTFTVGLSNDGFITSGKVFPIQNGLLVGHVVISNLGTHKIPVFGMSNPITSIAQLVGNYNYQGFGCALRSGGDVLGAFACLSHYGTVTIGNTGPTTDNFIKCKSGNSIIASGVACSATQAGTISAGLTAASGVFDLYVTGTTHIGWLFAFIAPNSQVVAVIDHDDTSNLEFGHTVLSTYASSVPGAANGNYFVKNNLGVEHFVTISGVSITSTLHPGVNGTLTFDLPWAGLTQYNIAASGVVLAASGVAMTAGTGAFTYNENASLALFGVGVRY
jgi:hypothetical protein